MPWVIFFFFQAQIYSDGIEILECLILGAKMISVLILSNWTFSWNLNFNLYDNLYGSYTVVVDYVMEPIKGHNDWEEKLHFYAFAFTRKTFGETKNLQANAMFLRGKQYFCKQKQFLGGAKL